MEFMLDFDGDGDFDEFDEEMIEYELQLMEDEMMFEQEERRGNKRPNHEEDWVKLCGLGVLIAIGIIATVALIILMLGN